MDYRDQERVAEGGAGGDVRVLRRLELAEGFTGEGVDADASVCVVLDVETTGLDHDSDAVVQVGLRRFRFDADGVITRIGKSYSWYEYPGRPIPPEITSLTGITDADVAGRRFPEADIVRTLNNATIVAAHNSAFDRKWIEKRFPAAAGLPWACSMADVRWECHGFDGRQLAFLGVQCGFYYDAHRADVDVDAVIALLRHRFDNGRTAMAEMMESAHADSWTVRAVGAAFEVKDRLRARGYRWEPKRRVWTRDIRNDDRLAEEFWLASNIYTADACPRAMQPEFERIDRWRRYA